MQSTKTITINPKDYDFMWKVNNFNFLTVSIWMNVQFDKVDCIATYKNDVHKFYMSKKARKNLSEKGYHLVTKGMPKFRNETELLISEAKAYFPEIESIDLRKLSNKELVIEFEKFIAFTKKVLSQYFHTEYFNHDKVQEKAESLGINNNFYLRSSPKETTLSKEAYERALLALDPNPDAIRKHTSKYSFILYNTSGNTLTEEKLVELLREIKDPKKVIADTERTHNEIMSKRKHHDLAAQIREMAELKFVLRCFLNKTIFTSNCLLDKFTKEIAKRAKISNIEEYHFKELLHFLKASKVDRKSFVVGTFNSWNPITGEKAIKIAEAFDRIDNKEVTEFKGMIGNKGHYIGRVKIVPFDINTNLSKIIAEMNKGDVLVTGSTGPEMIMACHKAGAIVTDEGGICSHAAIVSRELGIPSVIATKIATEVLKDGDLVEVDANSGTVKKLKKD